MSELLRRFHELRDRLPIPIVKIAEQTGIEVNKLYRFNSGDGDLRNDDAINLNDWIKENK